MKIARLGSMKIARLDPSGPFRASNLASFWFVWAQNGSNKGPGQKVPCSGSKVVKGKNIKDFCGKLLMAWAIENGVKSKYITRTFVSTDSEDYRKIALEHGAEAPFLRPAEISHDTATDFQLFEHFIAWMKENEPDRRHLCWFSLERQLHAQPSTWWTLASRSF